MSQPIQSRQGPSRSTDSSPLITPSGTPPIYHLNHHSYHQQQQQQHDKMQQFFSAFEGGNGVSGKGWTEDGRTRRKSENWTGMSGQGETSRRPSLPFFSNLSLSRPSFSSHTTTPLTQQHHSTSMSKQNSDSGSSDTSTSSPPVSGNGMGRPDPKRAATLPVDPKEAKRHYDPCREPKLLHFM